MLLSRFEQVLWGKAPDDFIKWPWEIVRAGGKCNTLDSVEDVLDPWLKIGSTGILK
jgi:hypothetical protein